MGLYKVLVDWKRGTEMPPLDTESKPESSMLFRVLSWGLFVIASLPIMAMAVPVVLLIETVRWAGSWLRELK